MAENYHIHVHMIKVIILLSKFNSTKVPGLRTCINHVIFKSSFLKLLDILPDYSWGHQWKAY